MVTLLLVTLLLVTLLLVTLLLLTILMVTPGQEFDATWFLPPTSYLRQWFTANYQYFPSTGERYHRPIL